MAIWNSKDFLSTKYTTAVIIDKGSRAYAVEIKNTIDDFFMVNISKQLYVFKLDGQRIYTWRHMGRKTCRFYIYTIDNYLPMSVQNNKELETILRENNLPKVNTQLFDLFKYLGKKEKHATAKDKDLIFKEHDLAQIVQAVADEEKNYPEAAENLKTFFNSLAIDKIITPVRHASEMLDNDVKLTDAKIWGDIEEQVKRTDKERKAMSNNVKDAKKNWLVIGIIIAFVVAGAVVILLLASNGTFDHIIPTIGTSAIPSGPPKNLNDFAAKYPTCTALQTAISNNEIKLSDVPQGGKDMLKQCNAGIVATPGK